MLRRAFAASLFLLFAIAGFILGQDEEVETPTQEGLVDRSAVIGASFLLGQQISPLTSRFPCGVENDTKTDDFGDQKRGKKAVDCVAIDFSANFPG